MAKRDFAALVEAAGGQAALVKRLASVGFATTTRSIRRWIASGKPSPAAEQAFKALKLTAKPQAAPCTAYDSLRQIFGTWSRVADELGVGKATLLRMRQRCAPEELAAAQLKLRHFKAEQKRAEAEVKRKVKTAIDKLAKAVKRLNNPRTGKGGIAALARLMNVDESRIRDWLKNGPPDKSLKRAIKLAQEDEQEVALSRPAPEAQPKPRAPERTKQIDAAAKAAQYEAERIEKGNAQALQYVRDLIERIDPTEIAEGLGVRRATMLGWLRKDWIPEVRWQLAAELAELYAAGMDETTMRKLRELGEVAHRIDHERFEHFENPRSRGFSFDMPVHKIVNAEVIAKVAGMIDAAKKRMGVKLQRWQLVGYVTAYANEGFSDRTVGASFEPSRGKAITTAHGSQVRPGGSPKAVKLAVPMGDTIAKKLHWAKRKGESAKDYNKRIDDLRNRTIPETILNITHTSFQVARSDFLRLLKQTTTEGVIYLEGISVKHYKFTRTVEEGDQDVTDRFGRPSARAPRR